MTTAAIGANARILESCDLAAIGGRERHGPLGSAARRSSASAGEIQTNTGTADLQITDMEMVEPIRQLRVDDIQLLAWRAGTNAQH